MRRSDSHIGPMATKSFKVRIEPSGHELTVEERETILEAALRHGFTLPYSCRNGACGMCKGKIVRGEVDYGTYEEKALTPEERRAGKALFCQARPLGDVVIEAQEISIAKDIVIKILPCRVVKMERAAHDVMILALKLPQNERLEYLPGQYIDILLPASQRRSFSIATAPRPDALLEIHVRRVPGGTFTEHVFSTMKEKDLLRFRGPLGIFFLRMESNAPLVFVAGGTGFAPIKAILEHALATGSTRPMHLYWGARSRRDLYLDALAASWAQQHANFRYTPVLSQPHEEDQWHGRTGWVHEAVLADYPDLSAYEVYASGPPPMIEAVKTSFSAHGLAQDRLHYDSFEFAHAN